jgi:predicted nucleotidyltransferase
MQRKVRTKLKISERQILDFCKRWNVIELALFGSVLRGELKADSDIDMLVTFASDAQWGLFDHLRMEQELSESLGRKVDLLTKRSVERSSNWLLREEILRTAEVVYES